jgi:small GTP-binding protein
MAQNVIKNNKIIVVGDTNVGKTTMLHNYVYGVQKRLHASTVGVDFMVVNKKTKQSEDVHLQLWDVAGHQLFRSIMKMFYKGILGAIVMFDVTNKKSFEDVSYWINDIRKNTIQPYSLPIPVILLANLHSQPQQYQYQQYQQKQLRVVSESEAKKIAKDNNMIYREICIDNETELNEMFEALLESICNNVTRERIAENMLQKEASECCIIM